MLNIKTWFLYTLWNIWISFNIFLAYSILDIFWSYKLRFQDMVIKNRSLFMIMIQEVKNFHHCCFFIWSGGLIVTGISWSSENFTISPFWWPRTDTQISFSKNIYCSVMGHLFRRSLFVIFKNAQVLSLLIFFGFLVQENIGNSPDFCC